MTVEVDPWQRILDLSEYNLATYLESFPLSPDFGLPLLETKEDIVELYRRLTVPTARLPGWNQLDVYNERFDIFTPKADLDLRKKAPYCPDAEGSTLGEGWEGLVRAKELENVARVELVTVKDIIFVDSVPSQAKVIAAKVPVVFKRTWNQGAHTEPTGLYFDEHDRPYLVSPIAIAVYFDATRQPHFYYDRYRFKRKGQDQKAPGFVWGVRPAKLEAVTKRLIREFVKAEAAKIP